MATTTVNLGLTKPTGTDTADIAVINTNMDLIDTAVAAKETPTGAQTKATTAQTTAQTYADTKDAAHLLDYVRQPGYAVDTGTANHLIVTLSPAPSLYVDGMGVAVKVKYASSAASDINVNGLGVKAVYDAFGNAVTNFRANTTYSLKYESVSGTFIVQGKGGGGNATAAQLLLGATAAADTGPIVGTMPNNGAVAITPTGSPQTIALGYHNGSGSVAGVTVPVANVLAGTTIAGQAGTMVNRGAVAMTPSAASQAIAAGYHNGSGTVAAVTFTPGNVLTGTTIAGTAGTMPNNGTVSITPSASPQGIAAGYHNGLGTVAAVTVPAANVLTGTTIAGTAGTMVNRGTVAITPSTVTQTIAAGYHTGSGTVAGDADLVAANIKNGANIFGVAGTAPIPSGTAVAANVLTGTTFSNASSVGVSGTMVNNGAVTITPGTAIQTIPAGYHNGSGTVVSVSTFTKTTASLTTPSSPATWDLWLSTSLALGKIYTSDATPPSPLTGDIYISSDPNQYGFAIGSDIGTNYVSAVQDRTLPGLTKVQIYREATMVFYSVLGKVQQWDGSKWVFIKTQMWNGSAWITVAPGNYNTYQRTYTTAYQMRKIDPTGALLATSAGPTMMSVTGDAISVCADTINVYYVTSAGYITKLDANLGVVWTNTSGGVGGLAVSPNFIYTGDPNAVSTSVQQFSKATGALIQQSNVGGNTADTVDLDSDENDDFYVAKDDSNYATRKFSHTDLNLLYYVNEGSTAMRATVVGKNHVFETCTTLKIKKRNKVDMSLVWTTTTAALSGSIDSIVVDVNGDIYISSTTSGGPVVKLSGTNGTTVLWGPLLSRASKTIKDLTLSPDGYLMVSYSDGIIVKSLASTGAVIWTQTLISGVTAGMDVETDAGRIGAFPTNW